MMPINKSLLLCSLVTMLACTDSKFKAVTPEPEPEKPAEALTSAVDSGDSVAPPPAPVVEPVTSSAVEDVGSLTDKHTISLKVDVVFAIDTSASMDDELISTQNNMQKLLTTLNSGKLDARIHLMLDQIFPLPAGSDATKIAFVSQRVDSGDAISRLTSLFAGLFAANYLTILGAPMPTPIAFRKEAKLEIVVISDDNGSGTGNLGADFDPSKTLKATFSSIIGLPTSAVGDTCDLANIGTEYINLATQTGGTALDLCAPDWSVVITRLSNDIVKRSVTFPLSKKPIDPKGLNVRIAGQLMAPAEWTYDAAKNSVTLIKTDAVKDQAPVTINYSPAL